MSNSIDPSALGDAITKELTVYHENVIEKINAAGKRAIKKLVSLTRKTVPVDTGEYSKAITHTEETAATGDVKYTWGAKAPHYRLTHLLVNGHATLDGSRVPGDPFLENALKEVLPEYEREIEEAITDG